ncbi:DUF3987 domain-containing protein [Actinomadura sp. KC345]|uniref:DUF3987 domain-containing protein n=1 Tax=Actinomadura sp. KC345 TaxID=2530371 RepID=UPI00104A9BD2|nr:DUF3987 domain-containing protein [Actinomadura sp. KC345]TDC52858.1 DUF3987 domain-containing protein [Actinomadura sp. KC345]
MASFIDAVKAYRQKSEEAPEGAGPDPFDSPADPFDAPSAPSGSAGGGDRAAGYAAAALDRELDALRAAPEGTRNHALNKAAFSLGQLVAGGELDENTVVSALTDAARAAGLDDKEIGKTINSGLSKGRLNPRTAPRERILHGVYENHEQAAASWTEPEPLGDDGDPPGPFPVEVLPGPVREFVTALAANTQTPVDMPAMTALSALSVVAANRAWISGGSGWVEPLVFWGITALPPASRKSAVVSAAARPLYAIERDARDRYAEDNKGTEERLAVALKRKDALISKAAKAEAKHERDNLQAELDEVAAEIDELTVGTPPRLLVDDITPEALGIALQNNAGHVGIISAEGGVFASISGRYQQGTPQLDLALKSYDGDAYRADRVGRDPVTIDRPAVVLGLAVQPHVLAETTQTPALRERGLMGRFTYCVPVDTVGARSVDAPEMPAHTAAGWHRLLAGIASLPVCGDDSALRVLQLDRDALELHRGFRAVLEPRLHAETGDLAFMTDWAGKLAGRVLRIAGLLHLAAGASTSMPVSLDTMHGAVQIGEWSLLHAVAVYGGWRGTDHNLGAERVLRWIRRTGKPEFTVREAWQALRGQAWCDRTDDVRDALVTLAEAGWLTSVERTMSDGKRRAKGGVFIPHPSLLEGP